MKSNCPTSALLIPHADKNMVVVYYCNAHSDLLPR